jgi:uncharacterized 2Fe-2S/4Fe-4S cluster protein (DUF4445 family)
MTDKQSSELHVSRDTKIVFVPSCKRGSFEVGTSVLDAALRLVIDVLPESQLHRQLVHKDAEQHDITLHISTRLYCVEVCPANIRDSKGDMERLSGDLASEWNHP